MKIEDMVKPYTGDQCLLCGSKPDCIGIFVPENPQKFGAVTGKSRFVRYCLCANCKDKADIQERVEKVILSGVAGGEVVHE